MRAEAVPPVSTREDLMVLARSLESTTRRQYSELAEQMRRGYNDETAATFRALADRERQFGYAEISGTDQASASSLDHDKPKSELSEAPYLMTPYRAFRLAVHNEEYIFDLFSQIAAVTEIADVRELAETLAKNHLQAIAALRVQRRRAYRAQAETAVGGATQNQNVKTPDAIYQMRQKIDAIISAALKAEMEKLAGQVSTNTIILFGMLLHEFGEADGAIEGEAGTREHDQRMTFAALRTLLVEIEAAFDIFMAHAENGTSEDVVNAAQETAQRYVRPLSLIRSRLDDLVSTDA